MITIQNVTTPSRPTGVHQYQLCINRHLIAAYYHNREEGLTVCLRRAAEAADKAKINQYVQLCGQAALGDEPPPRLNEGQMAEISAIRDMLARSSSQQMMIEVVRSFGEFRHGGDGVGEACRCALQEWDC